MKLSSGKRIGQSGGELAVAAFFSFFLHGILLAAALLYLHATPKKHLPPFYNVKLVGPLAEPAELPQTPPVASQPAPPKQAAKAAPKGKKAEPKVRMAASKKGAMPELSEKKQKTAVPEQAVPEAAPAAPSAAKTESVAVTAPQQDFKFGWYLANVRDKIGQNWRPLEAAKDVKARVIFTINRSGVVLAVDLDKEHSNGNFWFNQAAVRAVQSCKFPQLPDDFPKQTLELSVDLMAE